MFGWTILVLSLAASACATDAQVDPVEDSGVPANAAAPGAASDAATDAAAIEPDASPDTGAGAPCDNIDCSGHGECDVVAEAAVCNCDEGYVASGLECVEESAAECVDGEVDVEGVCDIWILRRGAVTWEGWSLDPTGSGSGPASTIGAAFDIEADDRAFVFTDAAIHVLRPSTMQWEAPRSLSDIAPGVASADGLIGAFSIPAGTDPNSEGMTIFARNGTDAVIWQRNYDIANDTFATFDGGLNGEVFQWEEATAPVVADITAAWLDLQNERGWASGSPAELCGGNATEIARYAAFLTPANLHYQDVGECFDFLDPAPVAGVDFLGYDGAPGAGIIGAAFWHQGALYLFRAN